MCPYLELHFSHENNRMFCVTIKNCKGVKHYSLDIKKIPLGSVAFKTSLGSMFREEKKKWGFVHFLHRESLQRVNCCSLDIKQYHKYNTISKQSHNLEMHFHIKQYHTTQGDQSVNIKKKKIQLSPQNE